MLRRALEAEVQEFLGRERYQRGPEFRGYRNGHGRERTVGIGTWAVPVKVPRVSDTPAGSPFESAVLPKRTRLSMETQKLFARLYLEGLSTGDFEPVFRQLLGETAPLSPNTILRIKEEWEAEYQAWRERPLAHERFLYVWADGIYLGAGLEKENSCLLTLLGARADGTKDLIAMEIGYRESKVSWGEVLRRLRDRGLRAPLVLIGDGNLGIWGAQSEVWTETKRQRCWNHRLMNLVDQLPKRLQPEVRSRMSQLYQAPTKQGCESSATSWWRGCSTNAKSRRRRRCCATGRTSSPSTTSPRSTGCTSAPPIRWSPSSLACGCAPRSPSERANARTRSTSSSKSCSVSAATGARSTVGRR
jgi:transposase-like protein